MNNEVLDFTQALKHFHTNYLNVPHTKCATYTLRTMSWTSLVSILPVVFCKVIALGRAISLGISPRGGRNNWGGRNPYDTGYI